MCLCAMCVTVHKQRSKANLVDSVLFYTFVFNTEVDFLHSLCDKLCSYSDFLIKFKYLMILIAYNILLYFK